MPGPREPKNVDPYLEPLLLDLVKYGPKGKHSITSACLFDHASPPSYNGDQKLPIHPEQVMRL